MAKFTVDVHFYPKTYEVEAETEAEARQIASDKFHSEIGGSIYETTVERND